MKKITLILISMLMMSLNAYSQDGYKIQGYNAENSANEELTGEKLMPANSNIEVMALNTISSEYVKKGDKVIFYLPTDLYYGKNLIAPVGTRVNGIIIYITNATGKKTGSLKLRFSSMVTPNGQVIPVSAEYSNNADSGNIIIKQNEKINITINQPITIISNTPY